MRKLATTVWNRLHAIVRPYTLPKTSNIKPFLSKIVYINTTILSSFLLVCPSRKRLQISDVPSLQRTLFDTHCCNTRHSQAPAIAYVNSMARYSAMRKPSLLKEPRFVPAATRTPLGTTAKADKAGAMWATMMTVS